MTTKDQDVKPGYYTGKYISLVGSPSRTTIMYVERDNGYITRGYNGRTTNYRQMAGKLCIFDNESTEMTLKVQIAATVNWPGFINEIKEEDFFKMYSTFANSMSQIFNIKPSTYKEVIEREG